MNLVICVQLTALAQLAALFLLPDLFLPYRMIPSVPVIPGWSLPPTGHIVLYISFALANTFMLLRPKNPHFIGLSLGLYLLHFFVDALRLAPFFYVWQLWLISLFTLYMGWVSKKTCLNTLKIIVIATYFWSGINKFNADYSKIIPWFLGEYAQTTPETLQFILAKTIPWVETLAALFLFFPKVRSYAAGSLILLHIGIIVCLGPWAHSIQFAVLWSTFQCFALWLLFGKSNTRISFSKATNPTHLILRICVAICPIFNYVGLWNDWLSFQIFTGRATHGNMVVSKKYLRVFPELEKFSIKDRKIPWSLFSENDSGVFYYPARWYFEHATQGVCEKTPPDLRKDLKFEIFEVIKYFSQIKLRRYLIRCN